jgi:WD40 repeat protein
LQAAGLVSWARLNVNGSRVLTIGSAKHAEGVEDGGGSEIKLWDSGSGKLVANLQPGRGKRVVVAQFNDDGTRLLVATQISVWVGDAQTGKRISEILDRQNQITSAAFNPAGTRVATTGNDGTARIWDALSGRAIAVMTGHDKMVASAEFSPDGNRLVTASFDKSARIWDVKSGKVLKILAGHGNSVWLATFSPGGDQVATVGEEGVLRVWDTDSGTLIFAADGHTARISSVSFAPDGKRILTAGNDGKAFIWDVKGGEGLRRHVAMQQAVRNDATMLVTATPGSAPVIWGMDSGTRIASLGNGHSELAFPQFAPAGNVVRTHSEREDLLIWEAKTGRVISRLMASELNLNLVSFSGDGAWLAGIGRLKSEGKGPDNLIRIWDTAGTQPPVTINFDPRRSPGFAAFSLDNRRLAVDVWFPNGMGEAELYDVPSLRRVAAFRPLFLESQPRIKFSPDGTRFVVTGAADEPAIRDAVTGNLIATIALKAADFEKAEFSPDGKVLATSGREDGTIRMWDAATGKAGPLLTAHAGGWVTPAFSHDGTRLLTIGQDRSARLWDVASGRALATLDQGFELQRFILFSTEGSLLVTAGWVNSTIRVWDARRGRLLASLADHRSALHELAINVDGSRIIATGSGHATVWEVVPEGRTPAEISAWVRCRVPWKLEGEVLVRTTPDPTACTKRSVQ